MKIISSLKSQLEIIAIILLIAEPIPTHSQTPKFTASAGYGFFYNDPVLRYQPLRTGLQSLVGPLYFKFDFRFRSKWSFEPSLIYYYAQWNEEGTREILNPPPVHYEYGTLHHRVTGYNVVLRWNYHLINVAKFDCYAGIGTGIRVTSFNLDPATPPCADGTDCNYEFPQAIEYTFPFILEGTMGLRYRIIPHLLAYCEMGYSKTALQLGLSGQF